MRWLFRFLLIGGLLVVDVTSVWVGACCCFCIVGICGGFVGLCLCFYVVVGLGYLFIDLI